MNGESSQWIQTLGSALLHFIWQGAVIGLLAALLLMLLRNARPQTRYLVACAALLTCALLPVASFVAGVSGSQLIGPGLLEGIGKSTDTSTRAVALEVHQAVTSPSQWQMALQAWLPLVVGLWSLGAALLALRMALGVAWVNRISSETGANPPPAWQQRLDLLARGIGIKHAVPLRIAGELSSPVAARCWRPLVIVPAALLVRMPVELVEALLAHELAHIRRHDYLVNLIQSAVEALLFYHPAVWWLSRQIRIERELVADNLAAQVLPHPRQLALALQRLDRFQQEQRPVHTPFAAPDLAPAAHGGNLMTRIQHLVRPTRRTLNWNIAVPIIGLLAVCFAGFAQTSAAAKGASPASGQELSYALVREGHETINVSHNRNDRIAVESEMRGTTGDFLWFRQDNNAFVIRDPKLLARVSAAWEPMDPLQQQMELVSDEMEPHQRAMEAISQRMDEASKAVEPKDEAMQALGLKMEALGEKQGAMGARMEPLAMQMARATDAGRREALEREMDQLQKQMEALQPEFERIGAAMEQQSHAMEAAHAPMQAIAREMEAASEPMEAIGKRMEAIGQEMESVHENANRETMAVVDEAIRDGKAIPVDGFSAR